MFVKGYKLTPEQEQRKIKNNPQKGSTHKNWKGGIKSNNPKEYYRIKNREWKRRNPDKVAHKRFLYRERLRNAVGSFTLGEWELLKKQHNWTCPYCKKSEPEIKLSRDHIIPLSKGGSNWIENIQPLCLHCNKSKNNRIIIK